MAASAGIHTAVSLNKLGILSSKPESIEGLRSSPLSLFPNIAAKLKEHRTLTAIGQSLTGYSNGRSRKSGSGDRRVLPVVCCAAAAQTTAAQVPAIEQVCGVYSIRGTERTTMEDAYEVSVDTSGESPSFFGVYDGHGGVDVAEYLRNSFWKIYGRVLSEIGNTDELDKATKLAYLEADKATLAPAKGFLGALRERGLGGSRCGATAATVVLLTGSNGQQKLVAANVGDARVVLARAGQAVQLTVDHTPDVEVERKRIEKKNPTPKKPLVVNVNGTWRVGGLLALSRAFGDVYLKDWSDGRDAQGGFGLIAEPHVSIENITIEDQFLIIASDGLWEFITNQEAVEQCRSKPLEESLDQLAKRLVQLAVTRGTTDDITAIIVQLPGA